MAQTPGYFSVWLKRSAAGAHKTHKATLAGLGLSRLGQVVFRKDIPSVRGMLYKVSHLVAVKKVAPGTEIPPSARERARKRAAG